MAVSDNTISNVNATIQAAVSLSEQIHTIYMGYNAFEETSRILKKHLATSCVFLVADEYTMAAAGNDLQKVFTKNGLFCSTHVFSASPRLKGTVENAELFLPLLEKHNAIPIAVGSGVINDLTRYAAFQLNKPFVSFATAASMDGYASAGAPLSQQGFKHTIPCRPPQVILADPDIIASAPREMAGWGYGDLAGKVPAGADWLIADALGIEKIDPAAWALVHEHLPTWLSSPSGVAEGDKNSVCALFAGLVSAGIAMEIYGSSRPASGADHQIAHLWEMDGLEYEGLPVSHGSCVALGALSTLALYEWMLQQDFCRLNIDNIIQQRKQLPDMEDAIRKLFSSPPIAEKTLIETRVKFTEDDVLKDRLKHIKDIWPVLEQKLKEFLIPFDKMEEMFVNAGVVTHPGSVGVDPEYHSKILKKSRFIRRRYTILDFLEDTGCFDDAVDYVLLKFKQLNTL